MNKPPFIVLFFYMMNTQIRCQTIKTRMIVGEVSKKSDIVTAIGYILAWLLLPMKDVVVTQWGKIPHWGRMPPVW
jgi:hypothetical protein